MNFIYTLLSSSGKNEIFAWSLNEDSYHQKASENDGNCQKSNEYLFPDEKSIHYILVSSDDGYAGRMFSQGIKKGLAFYANP
jgi:hypothetical protein